MLLIGAYRNFMFVPKLTVDLNSYMNFVKEVRYTKSQLFAMQVRGMNVGFAKSSGFWLFPLESLIEGEFLDKQFVNRT